jgi:hypothetical protein
MALVPSHTCMCAHTYSVALTRNAPRPLSTVAMEVRAYHGYDGTGGKEVGEPREKGLLGQVSVVLLSLHATVFQ